MSDDHAYQAISAYQNDLIQTPNIDRIASNGMLFTNASVTNSICAPSRAVILTGKHSHINGKLDNLSPFDTSNVTFPQLLQDAGYQTAMFGKLHFGNNPKGFDQFKILPGQGVYYNPDFITKDEGRIKMKGYTTDIITDMSIEWLEKERKDEQPFLLMYLHKAPHREWLMAERHMEEYTQRKFPEPATLFDDYDGRPAAQRAEMSILDHLSWNRDSKVFRNVIEELELSPYGTDFGNYRFEHVLDSAQYAHFRKYFEPVNRDFKAKYANMSREELMSWRYQRYMQDYLGSVKSIDENVGRLLDYLESNDLMENTVIVYTSDQGFYLGEHGWYDKRFVYDESFKTPLMISWPGKIQAGTTSDEMVQNLDFAQTFLEMAGVKTTEAMQGESLMPLLTGQSNLWKRDGVYYHYYEYPGEHAVMRHYAIVTKDYKIIHFYHDEDYWELIDRKKDPHELTNVYHDHAYEEVRNQLHRQLDTMRQQYGDSDSLSAAFLEVYLNRRNQ